MALRPCPGFVANKILTWRTKAPGHGRRQEWQGARTRGANDHFGLLCSVCPHTRLRAGCHRLSTIMRQRASCSADDSDCMRRAPTSRRGPGALAQRAFVRVLSSVVLTLRFYSRSARPAARCRRVADGAELDGMVPAHSPTGHTNPLNARKARPSGGVHFRHDAVRPAPAEPITSKTAVVAQS